MAYQYVFDSTAADEYENSFLWYEERSQAAADGFVIAVQDAITAVCVHPERYRNTFKHLRELTLKKYPFNLIYWVDHENQIIVIVSLFHHKRNPKVKYQKKKK